MSVKFRFEIPSDCWKLQKNLKAGTHYPYVRASFFCARTYGRSFVDP